MNKITIKDIAKMLSVSVSTVSRALADHPDISDETKTRVKEVAQKFNYLPNLHARFFRKKNTRMIALILPEFNRFFIPDLIKGIQQYADVQGYKLIIFQSGNQYETEAEIIKYCLSWVVEGVLISLSDDTGSLDHLKILKDSKIPVVLLDKVMTSKEYPTVTIDGFDAAYTATSAILQRGRKNILGVFGHENLSITKDRFKGFIAALEDHGVPETEHAYLKIRNIQHARSLLTEKTSCTHYDGLFFMTDELLVHGMNHFLKMGFQIPKDLSIVAISDGTSPHFLFPPVSHIFHSGYQIGKSACQLLIHHIQDEDLEVRHLLEGTNLIDLGSI
ncbi:MAG: LacI family DNA-binding transcriptional regulator [Saprospiraceae bacterium]|nr:LacI family DNA-binding transcriptional regulator [Saprospiraceae bacterium]